MIATLVVMQVLVLLVPELSALLNMSTTSHLPLNSLTRVALPARPLTTLALVSATVISNLVSFKK